MTTLKIAPGGRCSALARPKVVEALVTQQRRTRRHGNAAWRPLDEIGHQAGIGGRLLQNDLRLAEQQGLVDVKVRESGRFVTLSALALSLFGLGDRIDRDLEGFEEPLVEAEGAADGSGLFEPEQPGEPLVEVLVGWQCSSPRVEDLADHLGRDVEDLWDEFQELERRGLVEVWPDHPAGPAVMLSSLTADRLRLRLASDGFR